jgi:hypothetical protein
MTTIAESFVLVDERDLPELSSHAKLYRHSKTGAEVLSLENDDENKVFGISFRTPPRDSTGVAHILEHSVLCGSRKYPSKEPFVELLKGSLNTFLNAFTFPDKTCYPVASQNTQDFYNLVDVYLDSVFYPRLTPQIFAQEGWHYELETPDAPLVYRGIVFNEMKGAYGSPDNLLGEVAQQSLFPATSYGVDSGGHPQHIPDLTYEQLKHFHQTLYHPSNARIYFYGDDDPDVRLRIINEYLKEFQPLDPQSGVELQPRFDAPRRSVHTYRIDQDSPGQNKSRMTVNWLLPETSDPQKVLALEILSHILVGTPGSPLRKALVDSGLGEDLAGGGYVDYLRQGYFSIGLKGVDADHVDKVEALILQTLHTLATSGIERAAVDASLNTIEFRLRENNTGSMPRGLVAMVNALTTWLHDDDPFALLAFDKPLTAIKTRVREGVPYFENLLHEHFLDNSHRTTTILNPDPEQGAREAAQEKARLEAARAAMSPEDIQQVIEQTHELQRMQETPDSPDALAAIPSLSLDDIERENRTIPQEHSTRQGAEVLFHDLPTNGITYLDVGLNLHVLPQELLPYGALFGRALLEMGTSKEDYVKLSQRIGRKTGGISLRRMSAMVHDSSQGAVWMFLHGKATQEQNGELLAIVQDMLTDVQLDNRERLRQIVLERKARLEAQMVPAGHQMIYRRLKSCFNEAGWAEDQTEGIGYLFFLRRLLEEIEQDWPTVLARLEHVRDMLVQRGAMLCNVTLDREHWQQFAPRLDELLGNLPAGTPPLAQWSPAYSAGFEGLTIPAQVNYVGKAANIYQAGYQFNGAAVVVTKYLRTTWLWERIRMRGGAYGAFSRFDRPSGVFSYLSYRDPNLLNTLSVYDQSSTFLRETELGEQEVTRGIIGAISDIDAYLLPDARGYTAMQRYLIGDSDEARQRMRDEVLATTAADFRAFADVLDTVREQGIIAVMGSAEAIAQANDELERDGKRTLERIELL